MKGLMTYQAVGAREAKEATTDSKKAVDEVKVEIEWLKQNTITKAEAVGLIETTVTDKLKGKK